jgi:hypothetical protein
MKDPFMVILDNKQKSPALKCLYILGAYLALLGWY